MGIHAIFHGIVASIVVLIFSMPFAAFAQQNPVRIEVSETLAAEDADAVRTEAGLGSIAPLLGFGDGAAVGGCIGFAAGVLIPFIGIHSYQANPPPERILGKSPEYIEFYTDAYRSKTRSLRSRWAAIGAAVTGGGLLLLIVE